MSAGEEYQKHSGRIESTYLTIDATSSSQPDKLEISLTNGDEYVMLLKNPILLGKGDLVDLYISPIQKDDKLLVCRIQQKGKRIISGETESDWVFKKPRLFETSFGEGCR